MQQDISTLTLDELNEKIVQLNTIIDEEREKMKEIQKKLEPYLIENSHHQIVMRKKLVTSKDDRYCYFCCLSKLNCLGHYLFSNYSLPILPCLAF